MKIEFEVDEKVQVIRPQRKKGAAQWLLFRYPRLIKNENRANIALLILSLLLFVIAGVIFWNSTRTPY